VNAEVIQSSLRPAVAVVGAWDPFVPEHEKLLINLREYARHQGKSSAVIVLDPPPQHLVLGTRSSALYNGSCVRIQIVESLGIDSIIRLHMTESDLSLGAADLFDSLSPHVTVSEVWLGAAQTFGRGIESTKERLAQHAGERGIRLTRLPPRPSTISSRDLNLLLKAGRLEEATSRVGRPPVWKRPGSGVLHLAWCSGPYTAAPLQALPHNNYSRTVNVELQLTDGQPSLHWPDPDIAYLAFLSGPCDTRADPTHSGTTPLVIAHSDA
jgi:hypothetical protein